MLTNEITDVRSKISMDYLLIISMFILLSSLDAISVMKERTQTTEHTKAERSGQLTNREPNE